MAEEQGLEVTFEPPPQHLEFPSDDPAINALHEYIEALVTWAEAQFRRQANVSQNYTYLQLVELNEEPDRPTDGMIVLADGTNWNPGSGAGVYGYHSSAWNLLG